jgi:uncharacterized protein (DUF427 family)
VSHGARIDPPLTPRLASARSAWHWTGDRRPPFAIEPGPGEESVWDYPRPPALSTDGRRVIVRLGETVVAETTAAIRILETASPPSFYLPRSDVDVERLQPVSGVSFCEWKGAASYWTVTSPSGAAEVRGAWSYEDPYPEYDAIRGCIAFYPARFTCTVGGEEVRPQPGGFYGGWVTSEIVGPVKGGPGSAGW